MRHPTYLGLLVVIWATPVMTTGRLLVAGVWTVYLVVGTWLEERDLLRTFGEEYRRYQAAVPMVVPWPRRRP